MSSLHARSFEGVADCRTLAVTVPVGWEYEGEPMTGRTLERSLRFIVQARNSRRDDWRK